jgi:AcrR family transcriptional regulator
MPRTPDAELEGKILDAAYRLWSKGGSRALTMRAVARAAGTTTPTMYDRFRDKHDLLVLLRNRALEKIVTFLNPCRTPAAMCRKFLEFALAHPNEHRLLAADWAARLTREEDPKPGFELAKKRLAAQLGGEPEDHAKLAMALVALVHGTAMILHAEDIHEKTAREIRAACLEACDELIRAGKSRRIR